MIFIKSKITILFLFILIITSNYTSGINPKKTRYYIIDNGLKVFLHEKHNNSLVNIVFGVDLGSKDETSKTSGIVHILEHLILVGGTESKKSEEIITQIRKNGSYFNAHTGYDFMTLEISLPQEYIKFALNLVKEKIFGLKLTQDELDNEKKIIIEEINQTLDDPNKFGTSLALQNLFKGHSYEKPIYGEKYIIKNTTIKQLETFYKHYVIPSNCSIAIVGDFSIKNSAKIIQQTFGNIKKGKSIQRDFKNIQVLKKNVTIKKEMDITQSHLIIGFIAPKLNHKDKLAVNILVKILGQGINPLLGNALRVRRRLVEGISMRYISLKYGGAILIDLSMDPKNMKMAKRETLNFLKKTRSYRYSKEDYLHDQQMYIFDYLETAKNRLRLISEMYKEKSLSTASSYVRAMLLDNSSEKEDYKKRLEKIKSSDLRKIALKYLCGKKHVIISILPKGKK